jgi:hypothetical protein
MVGAGSSHIIKPNSYHGAFRGVHVGAYCMAVELIIGESILS